MNVSRHTPARHATQHAPDPFHDRVNPRFDQSRRVDVNRGHKTYRPRCTILSAALSMCMALTAPAVLAGNSGGLTTYQLTRKATSPNAMASAIYRDGSRETIKLSRASGWHSQMWFDFAAHKQWANDTNAPGQCSVITYTSDGPPSLLDPVPGAFDMAAQIPAKAPRSGKEKLGGVETSIIKMPDGGEVWLDNAHHLAMKVKIVVEGNPQPQTLIDLTGIRFDKPDPALLAPPTHCKQLAGSANANGGHASE